MSSTSRKDKEETVVVTLQVSDAKSAEEFRLESKEPELYEGDSSLDHIAAPLATTTLRELVTLLSDGPLRKRRRGTRDGEWGINDHLWEFRIVPPGETMEMDATELIDSFDSDDEDAKDYREVCFGPYKDMNDDSEMGVKYVDADDKLSTLSSLQVGSVLRLKYDFGTTTEVYLRCVTVEEQSEEPNAAEAKLGFVMLQQQQQQQQPLPTMESVPAFSWPTERRLDMHYPTFAQQFLFSTSTLGLSSRITRDEDSTFCTIEPPSRGEDSIFCPLPFDDINDFLIVAEYCLNRLLRQYISCMIFPPGDEGSKLAREATEVHESDPYAMLSGPRTFRSFSREEIDRMKSQRSTEHQFDFAQAFPKTHAQLTSGKFRWIRSVPGNKMRDPNTLKVVIGRAKGDRKAPRSQVTRTWTAPFKDLHELFCAVEASWVRPAGTERAGEELTADTFLPEHDTNLGPSKPLPPDPPVIADKDSAVVLVEPVKESPEITALAIAQVGAKPFVFAGDSNGDVRIFDLEDDDPEEVDDVELASHDTKNCGVRGLQVYHSAVENRTTVYAWMYPNESHGESDEDGEDEDDYNGLATLLSFDTIIQEDGSINGGLVQENNCQRDIEGLEGYFYDPMIAALVIAPALINGKWHDTIFVGFEGRPTKIPSFATDFSDYSLKDQENEQVGNILPIIEAGSENHMATWRGHEGCVRALAAIPRKYLVSLSVVGGMEWPGQLILWSLSSFGTPLHRIDLFLQDRSIKAFPPITGMPGGLCVHEENIMLWGNYGDTIVPIAIEESCTLKMKGIIRLGQHYDGADQYQGYMASPPECKHGVIIHAGEKRAWIFDISMAGSEQALDKDVCNKGATECGGNEWRDIVLASRGIAVAQVRIPEKSGPNDAKKRRETYADDAGVKVVAMNGKWLVTGQGNGALVKTKLPEDFNGVCGKTSGILNSSSWSMPQE